MIKVIAADMDGTLLNKDHRIDEKTYETVMKAINKGIRFMAATGRDYTGAMDALGEWNIPCDYVVSSGAEIRDKNNNILRSVPMTKDEVRRTASAVEGLKLYTRYLARGLDYYIGKPEDMVKTALAEIRLFAGYKSDKEILESDIYTKRINRCRCRESLEDILSENEIYKVFVSSEDNDALRKAEKALSGVKGIVSASSFPSNIEITNEEGQKGPAIKAYIEELGYSMDEVMVIGDSMNDFSMLSMNFGIRVAMSNGDERIKKIADYIAPPNYEHGVVWAIEKFCEM